jgi:hypothetical protein
VWGARTWSIPRYRPGLPGAVAQIKTVRAEAAKSPVQIDKDQHMVLPDYLSDIAREMRARSAAIRRDFATHKLSAGENREDLVDSFLTDHLPQRFGISTGMVVSREGSFSNQADLLIVDKLNNAPFYGGRTNKLWPAESVLSLIEVKTSLSPSDLRDSIAKGRRFKNLNRRFANPGSTQRIADSLFVIWGFDCPSTDILKRNLNDAFSTIPRHELPDFIVVPDRVVVRSGSCFELSKIGQPNSAYRRTLEQQGVDVSTFVPTMEVYDTGVNSLMVWYVWFLSWLMQAGDRSAILTDYIPADTVYGRVV